MKNKLLILLLLFSVSFLYSQKQEYVIIGFNDSVNLNKGSVVFITRSFPSEFYYVRFHKIHSNQIIKILNYVNKRKDTYFELSLHFTRSYNGVLSLEDSKFLTDYYTVALSKYAYTDYKKLLSYGTEAIEFSKIENLRIVSKGASELIVDEKSSYSGLNNRMELRNLGKTVDFKSEIDSIKKNYDLSDSIVFQRLKRY